ncbi:MAG: DUF1893 domain-containing protein [bacterium]
MYSFARFQKSPWSLVVLSGGRMVFKSRAKAIEPLLRYLNTNPPPLADAVIYDKYVGRAAALLMTLVGPIVVKTPIISDGGAAALLEHEIAFEAGRQVKWPMGVASENMCYWEKLAMGKSPREFLAIARSATDRSLRSC